MLTYLQNKEEAAHHEPIEEVAESVPNIVISTHSITRIPPKFDPSSFMILIEIGDQYRSKILCNLGASINLVPLSIYRKLGWISSQYACATSYRLRWISSEEPIRILERRMTKRGNQAINEVLVEWEGQGSAL